MHWILTANYTAEAIRAIGKNPSDRRAAIGRPYYPLWVLRRLIIHSNDTVGSRRCYGSLFSWGTWLRKACSKSRERVCTKK